MFDVLLSLHDEKREGKNDEGRNGTQNEREKSVGLSTKSLLSIRESYFKALGIQLDVRHKRLNARLVLQLRGIFPPRIPDQRELTFRPFCHNYKWGIVCVK